MSRPLQSYRTLVRHDPRIHLKGTNIRFMTSNVFILETSSPHSFAESTISHPPIARPS